LFAIIGHDLRAPIGSLKGLLELTNDHTISREEFLGFSTMLRNNVEHIYFTLNNLLQWANTQMEGMRTAPQNIKLHNIAEENCGLLQAFAKGKQIALYQGISQDVIVRADYEQISLVFRNLITNAIKFTPAGGTITLSHTIESSFCRISIHDTGIGINQKMLATLFQDNHYVSKSGTQGEKGTGLGLVLCKDFIARNRGSIRAESTEGKGTTFSFTLPLTKIA
jgi:signal transduction histidine kinase